MKNTIKDRDAKRLGEQLRDAVVEDYLQTGKCLDVKRIASQLRWSETKVRRVLDLQPGGAPYGVTVLRDGRGWVYTPTLWHLRGMVLALRTTLRDAASSVPREELDPGGCFDGCFDVMGGPMSGPDEDPGDWDNDEASRGHDESGRPL